MTSEPEYHPKVGGRTGGCVSCDPEIVDYCHERVRDNFWCLCELPDQLDYFIAGLTDKNEFKKYLNANGKTRTRWNRNA